MVMTSGDIGDVIVNDRDMEVVKNFVFAGALITVCGQRDNDTRRIMATGKAVM